MANSTFRKRDLNRYRKVYPFARKRERLSIVPSEYGFRIETGTVTFTAENSVTVVFTETFSVVPIVTVVAVDSSSNGEANVNVFISAISITSVTFQSSMAFTGTAHFHAIQVS